jgi:hypothetical protein
VVVGTFAALIVSGLTGRPPLFRIQFSALSIAILCTLPFLVTTEVKLNRLHKLGAVLLVGIGLYAGSMAIRIHERDVADAAAYRARLSEAKPYFSGKVISWGSALMWEWLITPIRVYSPLESAIVPSIGLFTRMPVMQSTLQRLGINDLGATLCTEPDVRLIADLAHVEMLQSFCEEHYRARPVYTLVFSHPRTKIYLSGQPQRLN